LSKISISLSIRADNGYGGRFIDLIMPTVSKIARASCPIQFRRSRVGW